MPWPDCDLVLGGATPCGESVSGDSTPLNCLNINLSAMEPPGLEGPLPEVISLKLWRLRTAAQCVECPVSCAEGCHCSVLDLVAANLHPRVGLLYSVDNCESFGRQTIRA